MTCSIEGCTTPARSRGWCPKHYMRWWTHGDPLKYIKKTQPRNAPPPPQHPPGSGHPLWRGDNVGYATAHKRIAKLQGKAADHACQRCAGVAAEWAYLHTDPQAKTQTVGGSVVSYSINPEHYVPMCVKCHRQFDREARSNV